MISYGRNPASRALTQTTKAAAAPAPAKAPATDAIPYRPKVIVQAVAPVKSQPQAATPTTRVEILQHHFNEAVGPLLDETRANNGYTVSYQPVEEVGGIVRLKLEVINHRNWAVYSVEIESTRNNSFVMKHGNNTSHMSEGLLPQVLPMIGHGILALRPNA